MIRCIAALLVAASFLTGCFPARFTKSPGATGRVTDTRTGLPIAGAQVSVSNARYRFPGQGVYWVTNSATGEVRPKRIHDDEFIAPSVADVKAHLRPPTVTTGEDGTFLIPPERKWLFYIVPMDLPYASGTLMVERDGYAPQTKMLRQPPDLIRVTTTTVVGMQLAPVK